MYLKNNNRRVQPKRIRVAPSSFIVFLPAIVSKSFVGFCHFVSVFFLLECGTFFSCSIHQLACKACFHCSFISFVSSIDNPSDSQRLLSNRSNFHWYLVCRTTDTSAFYFHEWFYVFNSFVEYFNTFLTAFLFDSGKGIVHNALSYTFFTVLHDSVDKFSDNFASVDRIWHYFANGRSSSSHRLFPINKLLSSFRLFSPVLTSTDSSFCNAGCIQCTTNDVVLNTW